MKSLALLLLFSVLQIYSRASVSAGGSLSIQADEPTYSAEQILIAPIKFINHLGREVSINNSGCGFPRFVLEKQVNAQWQEVGEPICIAVVVAPTQLLDGQEFSATVQMGTEGMEGAPLQGAYRLRFFVTEKDGSQPLPAQSSVTNAFSIGEK
jgi:hypothetical protein